MSAVLGKVLLHNNRIAYTMQSAGIEVGTTWYTTGDHPSIHLVTATGDAGKAADILGLGSHFRTTFTATEDIESWRGTVDGIEVSTQHVVPANTGAVAS